MERRYLALRIVAVVYKALSILILLGAVITALLSLLLGATILANTDLGSRIPVGGILMQIASMVITVILGILLALPFAAAGQLIDLFIAMEQHSRATSQMMQQQTSLMNAMLHQLSAAPALSAPPMSPQRPAAPLPPREQIGAASG